MHLLEATPRPLRSLPNPRLDSDHQVHLFLLIPGLGHLSSSAPRVAFTTALHPSALSLHVLLPATETLTPPHPTREPHLRCVAATAEAEGGEHPAPPPTLPEESHKPCFHCCHRYNKQQTSSGRRNMTEPCGKQTPQFLPPREGHHPWGCQGPAPPSHLRQGLFLLPDLVLGSRVQSDGEYREV